MTVNNIGPSSLLTSYIEKQNNTAVQKSPVVQNPATRVVQASPEQSSVNQQPAKKKISKKVIVAGICAALAIAGIVIFALCSRKKPEISPELQTSLQEFVDAANDFLTF